MSPAVLLCCTLAVSSMSMSVSSMLSMQRRENAKVEVFNAEGKGMGLRLLEPTSKGQFIAEYVGEVRDVKQKTCQANLIPHVRCFSSNDENHISRTLFPLRTLTVKRGLTLGRRKLHTVHEVNKKKCSLSKVP